MIQDYKDSAKQRSWCKQNYCKISPHTHKHAHTSVYRSHNQVWHWCCDVTTAVPFYTDGITWEQQALIHYWDWQYGEEKGGEGRIREQRWGEERRGDNRLGEEEEKREKIHLKKRKQKGERTDKESKKVKYVIKPDSEDSRRKRGRAPNLILNT